MNINTCYYTGLYKSVTDDWMGAIEATVLTVGLASLGLWIGTATMLERRLQGEVVQLEDALNAADANDPDRLHGEDTLRRGQQALRTIRGLKYVLLAGTLVTCSYTTSKYCAIGCPGFDYLSEVKSALRQFLPGITRNVSLPHRHYHYEG